MPVNLGSAHPLDQFKCDLCDKVFIRALIHEHHLIKRANGGKDTRENLKVLDANCHTAIHRMEDAFKAAANPNAKKKTPPRDLAVMLFPDSEIMRNKLMDWGGTAAIGRDNSERGISDPDHSFFDTDDLVQLAIVKVHPHKKKIVQILARSIKGPTGRPLGIASYLELLIDQEIRKRGFDPNPPKQNQR